MTTKNTIFALALILLGCTIYYVTKDITPEDDDMNPMTMLDKDPINWDVWGEIFLATDDQLVRVKMAEKFTKWRKDKKLHLKNVKTTPEALNVERLKLEDRTMWMIKLMNKLDAKRYGEEVDKLFKDAGTYTLLPEKPSLLPPLKVKGVAHIRTRRLNGNEEKIIWAYINEMARLFKEGLYEELFLVHCLDAVSERGRSGHQVKSIKDYEQKSKMYQWILKQLTNKNNWFKVYYDDKGYFEDGRSSIYLINLHRIRSELKVGPNGCIVLKWLKKEKRYVFSFLTHVPLGALVGLDLYPNFKVINRKRVIEK